MTVRSVLGIFAHPDDETILAGGTFAMLSRRGVQVHVALATRGEGGEAGEPPIVADRSLLGPAREAELRCAAEAVGAATVTFLGYVDPDIQPGDVLSPFAADYDTLTAQIADVIAQTGAEAVLTHGPDGEYGHPAHILIHRAVGEAIRQETQDVLLYSLAASVPGIEDRIWNTSRPAHFVLDITPWAEAKIAAMECHASQHALFKRRKNLQRVADALRPLESFYREWPDPGTDLPEDAFAGLLFAAGARRFPHP